MEDLTLDEAGVVMSVAGLEANEPSPAQCMVVVNREDANL
jgi:hypothetical protein